ncbi:hypothetical protein IQ26_05291 [Mesorhizobium tianshanense]|uniref:Uncharacterized protein n=1 Tax=Mesorhizobium tianshanense TaxID=39844 RepID=A0A562N8H5_9HYPH|nr:hypothetical protein IQ26_05291 [Mesorhizobium tianshanense]
MRPSLLLFCKNNNARQCESTPVVDHCNESGISGCLLSMEEILQRRMAVAVGHGGFAVNMLRWQGVGSAPQGELARSPSGPLRLRTPWEGHSTLDLERRQSQEHSKPGAGQPSRLAAAGRKNRPATDAVSQILKNRTCNYALPPARLSWKGTKSGDARHKAATKRTTVRSIFLPIHRQATSLSPAVGPARMISKFDPARASLQVIAGRVLCLSSMRSIK